MTMCQLSRRTSLDLHAHTFDEGWNELFPALRARRWQTRSVCRACNLASLCGSCPGAAEMETGDVEALVPQFCEIAHLRAHAVLADGGGHRRDASCCLGQGRLAGESPEKLARLTQSGCGSCGHAEPAPASAGLIQLQLRRPEARA
jgi:radical SAM protein with 4Fe4S-binding SPASM domain